MSSQHWRGTDKGSDFKAALVDGLFEGNLCGPYLSQNENEDKMNISVGNWLILL